MAFPEWTMDMSLLLEVEIDSMAAPPQFQCISDSTTNLRKNDATETMAVVQQEDNFTGDSSTADASGSVVPEIEIAMDFENMSPASKQDEMETQNSKSNDGVEKCSLDEPPDMMDLINESPGNDVSLADTPMTSFPPPPLTLEDKAHPPENTEIESSSPNASNGFPLLSETTKEIEVLIMLSGLEKATDFNTEFIAISISELQDPNPILESQEFSNLPRSILKDLLEKDELEIPEIQIYNAVILWAEHRIENPNGETTGDEFWKKIRQKLIDLIPYIRFPLMSVEEFVSSGAHNLMPKGQWTKILTFIAINAKPIKHEIKIGFTLPFSSVPRLPDKSTGIESGDINSRYDELYISGSISENDHELNVINPSSEDEPRKKIQKMSSPQPNHSSGSKNAPGTSNNSAGKPKMDKKRENKDTSKLLQNTTQDFLYGFNVPFPDSTKSSDKRKAAKVLEIVLKCIPSPELLKLRRVSTKWNKMSKSILRKRWDSKVKLLLQREDNSDDRTNWKFLAILNDAPENGFVAPVMKLTNSNESDKVSEEVIVTTIETIKDICKEIGNRKGLTVTWTLSIGDETQRPHFSLDFLWAVLRNLSPVLGTLKISKMDWPPDLPTFELPLLQRIILEDGFDIEKDAKFLKTILGLSPNVRIINLAGITFNWKLILLLREPGSVKFMSIKTPETLDALLKYPKIATGLQRLFIEANLDPKKLEKFLCKLSLKELKFEGNQNSKFTLPLLPVLKRLYFEAWNSSVAVNYGIDTPALKKLTIISRKSFDEWEELILYKDANSTPPCPSLEELWFYVNLSPRTQKMFSNLQMLFPNLKKLHTSLDDPYQLEICSTNYTNIWPNLEVIRLHLKFNKTNDSSAQFDFNQFFFGIGKSSAQEIDTNEDKYWEKIPTQEIHGIFGSYKCLKKLRIEVSVPGHGYVHGSCSLETLITLSDFTIYFALQFMQNLEMLEITTDYPYKSYNLMVQTNVSPEALDFLIKKLPGLKTLRVGGNGLLKDGKLPALTASA